MQKKSPLKSDDVYGKNSIKVGIHTQKCSHNFIQLFIICGNFFCLTFSTLHVASPAWMSDFYCSMKLMFHSRLSKNIKRDFSFPFFVGMLMMSMMIMIMIIIIIVAVR